MEQFAPITSIGGLYSPASIGRVALTLRPGPRRVVVVLQILPNCTGTGLDRWTLDS
jgi:hypothetical protein